VDVESIHVSDHVLAGKDTLEKGDVLYVFRKGSKRGEMTYLAIEGVVDGASLDFLRGNQLFS
jgi:hypothetical protein